MLTLLEASLLINTVVVMTTTVSTSAASDQQETLWSLPPIILGQIIPCYFTKYIPYSHEQKHVSISDTPMLQLEINSISNMGRQK